MKQLNAYQEFIQKHSITNIPTVDDLANYYVDNYDIVKNLRMVEIYQQLVDIKSIPINEEFMNKARYFFTPVVSTYLDRSFINIVDSNSSILRTPKKDEKENGCKLWINTDANNLPTWFDLFVNYFKNCNNPEIIKNTSVKFSYKHQRNDIITIYGDYRYIDDLIKYLKSIKENQPEMFASESKKNPLISTLDDMVSFADLSNASYPKIIASLMAMLNSYNIPVNSMSRTEFIETVKSLILNIFATTVEYPNFKESFTTLHNPNNIASVRGAEGLLPCDYDSAKIEEISKDLRSQITVPVDQFLPQNGQERM